MSYNILLTLKFEKALKKLMKKYYSLKDEYAGLIVELKKNPRTGIPLGNDCYKIRISIASKGKGKRGGARVITYIYLDTETVYLLALYDKSEMDNIKEEEIKDMLQRLHP